MKNKVIPLLVVIFLIPFGMSHETIPAYIHLSGKLNGSSGGTIHIKLYANNNSTGTSNILVGYGALIRTSYNDSSYQIAHFQVQTGVISGNLVELTGNVIKATDPNMVGSPISIEADPLTGNMTLAFVYGNYTGTGFLLIR